MLDFIQDKIISDSDFSKWLSRIKFSNRKIVFTNGCFDVLHLGHVHYLAEAKALGHYLVVGLNSDASVSKLKGEGRPINEFKSRSKLLASLLVVDAVIEFEEETPFNLINRIKPDILVKGGDYKLNQIVGADVVLSYGGEVKTLAFQEGFSSSSIINKIQSISDKK